jgi:hypothetical protein
VFSALKRTQRYPGEESDTSEKAKGAEGRERTWLTVAVLPPERAPSQAFSGTIDDKGLELPYSGKAIVARPLHRTPLKAVVSEKVSLATERLALLGCGCAAL